MDPNKVDGALNWKVPTTKELLRGFLGSVGYLADDIGLVRIPMGVLSELTSSDHSFHWNMTHQRAFDEIKRLMHEHREHRHTPLQYGEGAPRIWLTTDGSVSGIAGVISQGNDRRTAKVATFFSAKLTSAQVDYPVHELEMLAGVESMRRHRDVLLGCQFTWVTDHKGLTHLLKQKTLSARQARWIERISEFNFDVEYLPGPLNVLPDALSRIYSNDAPGTVRAPSEFTEHDEDEDLPLRLASFAASLPVFVDAEAQATHWHSILPESSTVAEAAAPARRSPRNHPPPSPRPRRPRKENPSNAFAKRVKKLVVHGPREQRVEGGSESLKTQDLANKRPPLTDITHIVNEKPENIVRDDLEVCPVQGKSPPGSLKAPMESVEEETETARPQSSADGETSASVPPTEDTPVSPGSLPAWPTSDGTSLSYWLPTSTLLSASWRRLLRCCPGLFWLWLWWLY